MEDFLESPLLRELATAFTADLASQEQQDEHDTRFFCRPLAARTSERCTALGRFYGHIGLPSVEEFKAAMNDLAEENVNKVILDFSEAALTRSAIGALVGFAASMHGRNKRLYLLRCSDQVRGQIHELGLKHFFTYLETEDDMLTTVVV